MQRRCLQLISAADARFFPGLRVALGSAVGSASGCFDYCITVLDGGIQPANWSMMDSELKRIGQDKGIAVELVRIDATGSLLSEMPARRGSPMTFARLMIPSLVKIPKAVYLDSDVVCLRGIEEFWTALETGQSVAAVKDPLGTLGRDPLTRELPMSEHQKPYFNAGIIGMNLDHWRTPEVESKIRELLLGDKQLRYADQSLLNFVFHDQWHELPPPCNCVLTVNHSGDLGRSAELTNYHYIGSNKPWLSNVSNFYRHPSNLLFDRMHRWISGSSNGIERTVSAKSLSNAHRKCILYRFFLPSRHRQYRAALECTAHADAVCAGLMENWLKPAEA